MTASTRSQHAYLSVCALVIGVPFVTELSLWFIYSILTRLNQWPPQGLMQLTLIFAVVQYIFDFLISNLGWYIFLSLTGAVLTVAALWLTRPRWNIRLALVVMLFAILALPFINHYQPAVSAAPGYVMYSATQPNLIEGVAKQAAVGAEVTPCTYQLLGWSADNTLYYQSICGATIQTWAFAMNGKGAQLVSVLPANLNAKRPIVSVVDWVRADAVLPIEAEPNTRRMYVREDGIASPGGRWVAFIARHVYGPEDVLIVGSQ